jgi:hypothetical protein
MRNAQTLPFGQPAPQVDAGGHHGLVEVGRRHPYRSTIIPMPAAPNIPGIPSRRGTTRERRPDAGARTPVVSHQLLPRPRQKPRRGGGMAFRRLSDCTMQRVSPVPVTAGTA